MINPYKVLGVNEGASQEEIRAAYLKLVKKYHPDKYIDSDLKELANEKLVRSTKHTKCLQKRLPPHLPMPAATVRAATAPMVGIPAQATHIPALTLRNSAVRDLLSTKETFRRQRQFWMQYPPATRNGTICMA